MVKPILSHFIEIIDQASQPVVVEIGACDGFHTQIMASLLRNNGKSFKFHSFEPVPSLQACWRVWNTHHIDHVNFFPQAVGTVDGTVPFYFSSANYYGSSSLRKPKLCLEGFPQLTFKSGNIDSTRLDTHAQKHSLDHIDFIWMDVQGAERDVFAGGADILKKTHYIYTEYVDIEHYEGEYTLDQLHTMLGKSEWKIVQDFGGDVLFQNLVFSKAA